ncbi:TraB/GumN family protein [Treponema sp.]|uniref:TraB/GumN family protein n=1 Tax=Treponema sp. TaxID=166 RepID=UPI0025F36FE9|nr:TraB/GumN family protein [Treponema sp.]MCR5218549.1 TraB/GumN family protein [Treponema sp.]
MNTATQKFLEFGSRKIILVGTAHVSAQSIEEVKTAIRDNQPDNVAIELDEKRLASIEDPESWRKMDIVQVLKKKMGFLMLANIILAGYQKRMGEGSGVKPGDEMAAAINTARELGIPQTMVDRPIGITLKRAWSKNSLWGKCKLLAILLGTAFAGDDEDSTPEKIEELKKTSEMDTLMKELSGYLPVVKEVLIDERDRYLASKIWECKGDKVLAVLGAGHLPGVMAYLTKLAAGEKTSDCSDIDSLPPKGLASKIGMWAIPLIIIALIASGFYFGGKSKGWDMLSAWVIWNGALAGVGAIIALAHPLVILISVIGAPVTSLCPFVGIGLVAGLLQAVLKKPSVGDMENLQKDASSFKGFYKNRILRVLLVFFLSSLGSSIGTFAAGASLVASVTTFFNKIISWIKGIF